MTAPVDSFAIMSRIFQIVNGVVEPISDPRAVAILEKEGDVFFDFPRPAAD